VNTLGTAMLGLTLGCARCHDHKYDPVKQRDYYSLFAFFNNIDESGLYSHFTRATPTPRFCSGRKEVSGSGRAENENRRRRSSIGKYRREAVKPFQAWLRADGQSSAAAHRPLRVRYRCQQHHAGQSVHECREARRRAEAGYRSAGLRHGAVPQLSPTRRPEADANELALQFSGDNQVVCKEAGNFTRTDPFSFSLWLKPTEPQDRAVVLHHSRAWTDSGSRGYELVLDHGRPFFGLIHFWPATPSPCARPGRCHERVVSNGHHL
jgi:hypothetical protein